LLSEYNLYKRCNPVGTACDTAIVALGSPPKYGLFKGYEVHLPGVGFCFMQLWDDIDKCYSRMAGALVAFKEPDLAEKDERNESAQPVVALRGWPLRIEVTNADVGDECIIALYGPDPTITRIGSRDREGNWTTKTILERGPISQSLEPTAVVYRTITY